MSLRPSRTVRLGTWPASSFPHSKLAESLWVFSRCKMLSKTEAISSSVIGGVHLAAHPWTVSQSTVTSSSLRDRLLANSLPTYWAAVVFRLPLAAPVATFFQSVRGRSRPLGLCWLRPDIRRRHAHGPSDRRHQPAWRTAGETSGHPGHDLSIRRHQSPALIHQLRGPPTADLAARRTD